MGSGYALRMKPNIISIGKLECNVSVALGRESDKNKCIFKIESLMRRQGGGGLLFNVSLLHIFDAKFLFNKSKRLCVIH